MMELKEATMAEYYSYYAHSVLAKAAEGLLLSTGCLSALFLVVRVQETNHTFI
jgi:hypothetical protein